MPSIVQEDLWMPVDLPALYVITTNSTIKANGALVMGRGAALQARNRIPGIEFECGRVVTGYIDYCNDKKYGFRIVRSPFRASGKPPVIDRAGFGIFQTKVDPAKPSDLTLIAISANDLEEWAKEHSDTRVRLNYPGIGLGGLPRAAVEPLLEGLPDNVTICYRIE